VTVGAGSSATAMELISGNADINFLSTLNSDVSNRSLTINAGTGTVLFGDKVGSFPLNYAAYSVNGLGANIYDLTVEAARIVIKGDVLTLDAQVYRGAISISDNGTNGLTRNLISVDPSITFTTTIDDVVAGTHSLYISAASLAAATNSIVNFQQGVAAVGSLIPLLRWEVHSGMQDATPMAFLGAIAPGPSGTITSNGTALPSGSYAVDTIPVNPVVPSSGGGGSSTTIINPVISSSGEGVSSTTVINTVPAQFSAIDNFVQPLAVVPVIRPAESKSINSLLEAPLRAPMHALTLRVHEREFRSESVESSVTVITCDDTSGKTAAVICEDV
jgi:hypothetical protein